MSTDLLTIESTVAYRAPTSRPVKAEEVEHDEAGSTPTLGCWIYLMSDCLFLAALFATYSVLAQETAGGPTGRALFSLPYVLTATVCLPLRSFTYGMSMLALNTGRRSGVLGWLAATFLLGLCCIGMEINEFHRMIGEGAGPDRSAFLSSFFTLVGTHGLHVTSGLIWMAVMMTQVALRGLSATNSTRLMCLSLFWHFLDIVWIGVFSVVYLMGSM